MSITQLESLMDNSLEPAHEQFMTRQDSEYTLGTQDTYSVNDEEDPTQSDIDFEVCDDEEDEEYSNGNTSQSSQSSQSNQSNQSTLSSSNSNGSKFSVTERDLKKIRSKSELQDMLLRAQERVIEIQVRIEELGASPERLKTRARTRASRMAANRR